MVRKHSKFSLNTGNTIRRYARESRLREQQRYSCLTVLNEIGENDTYAARNAVRELSDMFPCTDHIEIEYSLNKQCRWDLPDCIKAVMDEKHHKTDVQMTMVERDISIPTCRYIYVATQELKPTGRYSCTLRSFEGFMTYNCTWSAWLTTALGEHIKDTDRCKCYHSNASSSLSADGTGMTLATAKRGSKAEDHMTRAQRKSLNETGNRVEEKVSNLPKFELCVSYGAPSSGKFYLDAYNHQKQVSRAAADNCHYKFLRTHRKSNRKIKRESLDIDWSDDEDDTCDDVPIAGTRRSPPAVASLSDFVCKANTRRERKRRSKISRSNKLKVVLEEKEKKHVHYISRPTTPAAVVCSKPILYAPTYSRVLITTYDLTRLALHYAYGLNYREAYCTPRTIIINLSGQLVTEANGAEFYIVLVQVCEGSQVDQCRLYCCGLGVTFELSSLTDIDAGKVYELSALVCLVLEHRKTILPAREDLHNERNKSAVYCSDISCSSVCTTALCDVIRSALSVRRQMFEAEMLEFLEKADRELVVVPSMQCTICLEDINGGTLHTAVQPCLHDFCNLCWNRHLNTSIYQGLVHITCMQCNTQLHSVFIMSMVEFSTYCLYEVLLAHNFLSRDQAVKPCPALSCSRLIHCHKKLMETDQPLSVRCLCSNRYCFRCMKEPHWPLSCEQLTNYHNKVLSTSKHPWLLSKEEIRREWWCECITARMKETVNWQTCYHCCAVCLQMYCCMCSKLYRQSAYHSCGQTPHRLYFRKPTRWFPSQGFAFAMILRSAKSVHDDACAHRWYRTSLRPSLTGYIKTFLANTSKKKLLVFPGNEQFQSLQDFLHQVVEQILATHNLLEYCCAVNVFKKRSKYCVPTISLLSYSVDVLERQLSSGRCNQYTVDRLVKYYVIVKSNTQILVHKMSQLLSLVKPSTTH